MPREIKWLDNSYRTWTYLPLVLVRGFFIPLYLLSFAFLFLLAICAFCAGAAVALMALGPAGILLGPFIGIFFSTVISFTALTIPSALFLAQMVLEIAIKISFGAIGLTVGLISLPLLQYFEPHDGWTRFDSQRADREEIDNSGLFSILFSLRVVTTFLGLTPRPEGNPHLPTTEDDASNQSTYQSINTQLSVDETKITKTWMESLDFSDFNPNVTRCALTGQDLGLTAEQIARPDDNPLKVIKHSNGEYYLINNNDIEESDRIVPTNLREKFVNGQTTCPVTLSVLGTNDTVPVRSPYGHYFDSNMIKTWLKQKQECPITRQFLTKDMLTTVNVGELTVATKENGKQPMRAVEENQSIRLSQLNFLSEPGQQRQISNTRAYSSSDNTISLG